MTAKVEFGLNDGRRHDLSAISATSSAFSALLLPAVTHAQPGPILLRCCRAVSASFCRQHGQRFFEVWLSLALRASIADIRVRLRRTCPED